MSELETEEEVYCDICRDNGGELVIVHSHTDRHRFHPTCLEAWWQVTQQRTCPTCHQLVDTQLPFMELEAAISANDFCDLKYLLAVRDVDLHRRMALILYAKQMKRHEMALELIRSSNRISARELQRHYIRHLQRTDGPEKTTSWLFRQLDVGSPIQAYYLMCGFEGNIEAVKFLHSRGVHDLSTYHSLLWFYIRNKEEPFALEVLQNNKYTEEKLDYYLLDAKKAQMVRTMALLMKRGGNYERAKNKRSRSDEFDIIIPLDMHFEAIHPNRQMEEAIRNHIMNAIRGINDDGIRFNPDAEDEPDEN